jgi:nicotinamidase-related amidase
MPAIQATGAFVTDASGGVSHEAHDLAVQRMIAAGANPMTWLAVLGEWQRDWARIALGWEQQLLHSAKSAAA